MASSGAAGTEQVDVVVVGAGLAGIVCAAALQPSCRVAVLEARSRIGGRLLSTPGGADLGGSWSWPQHERKAKAPLDNSISRLVISLCAKRQHRSHLVGELAQRLCVGVVPQRTKGQVLRRDRPTGKARRIGEVGDQVAMCGPDAVRMSGGFAQLPKLLADNFPGDVMRLGCRVLAVEQADGERIRVAYERVEAGERVELRLLACRVVLALPPQVAAAGQIRFSPPLPEDQQRQMSSTYTWAGDWGKVVATFKSPFWRAHGDSGIVEAPSSRLVATWWEAGGGSENGEPLAALAGVTFGHQSLELSKYGHQVDDGASSAELQELVKQEMHAVFGAEAVEQLISVHHKSWLTDPLTHPEPTPDQQRGDPRRVYGHPLLKRALPWGVHFAGTETESEAGHVEGAIMSGERVAKEVKAALGVAR